MLTDRYGLPLTTQSCDGSAGAPGTAEADAAAAAAADALFFEALARLIDAHAALCVPPPPHPAA